MNTKMGILGVLVLMFGFLSFGLNATAQESAEQDGDVHSEFEENGLPERTMPIGWIDDILEERIIIDDTLYLLTEKTTFPSGRDSLVRGGFVEFNLGRDNYIVQISTAVPRPIDIEMRRGEQFSRRVEDPDPKSEPIETGRKLHLENGVWVN